MGLVLLAACRSLVDVPLPPDAEPMTPPPVYATWWAMTEGCSGVTGALDQLRWYQVPNATYVPFPGKRDVTAYWSSHGNYILTAGLSALDGSAVRHEMLHALVRLSGHPRSFFLDKCGGVVVCNAGCIAEAEAPAPADPAERPITPDQLRPTITISPAAPSMQIDGGFFTVTVAVTNTSGHAGVVVPPDGDVSSMGTTFGYIIQGPYRNLSNDVWPQDVSAVRFATGETKRQVFDFRVGFNSGSLEFRPGAYSIGVHFGRGQPWTYRTTTFQQ